MGKQKMTKLSLQSKAQVYRHNSLNISLMIILKKLFDLTVLYRRNFV